MKIKIYISNNELSKSPNVREIVEKLDLQLKPINNNSANIKSFDSETIESNKTSRQIIDSSSFYDENIICESVNVNKINIYPNIKDLQSECLTTRLNDKNNRINSD